MPSEDLTIVAATEHDRPGLTRLGIWGLQNANVTTWRHFAASFRQLREMFLDNPSQDHLSGAGRLQSLVKLSIRCPKGIQVPCTTTSLAMPPDLFPSLKALKAFCDNIVAGWQLLNTFRMVPLEHIDFTVSDITDADTRSAFYNILVHMRNTPQMKTLAIECVDKFQPHRHDSLQYIPADLIAQLSKSTPFLTKFVANGMCSFE